jgi:peptidyl-prolyl cis-trans isomerase SurA
VIKIKKKIFFIVKYTLVLAVFLTLVLFFYAAFFFEPSLKKIESTENKIIKEEEKLREEEGEKQKLKKSQVDEKISDTTKNKTKIKQVKTTLKDGLYAVLEDKAITKSDIINEIKAILILNNMTYSDDNKNKIQQMAAKSIIKKNIKKIEIGKKDFLKFKQEDVNNELNRLANRINMDIATLKNICLSNGLDFSIIEDQIITDLLWNSLIFYLYGNRVSVNLNEIDEQLKLYQNKIETEEYLISEIIIKHVEKIKLESEIKKLIEKIEIEGFEKVAMHLSISQSAKKSGDLGWLNESKISKKFKSIISNTPVGGLSKPILLKNGILIFKVRDKRKIKNEINLEELKNQLVILEKTKILNMYSKSHYDNLKRSTPIKFFNE